MNLRHNGTMSWDVILADICGISAVFLCDDAIVGRIGTSTNKMRFLCTVGGVSVLASFQHLLDLIENVGNTPVRRNDNARGTIQLITFISSMLMCYDLHLAGSAAAATIAAKSAAVFVAGQVMDRIYRPAGAALVNLSAYYTLFNIIGLLAD